MYTVLRHWIQQIVFDIIPTNHSVIEKMERNKKGNKEESEHRGEMKS